MEIFGNFLAKYKKIILDQEVLINKIQEVIKNITKVELSKGTIVLKNNTIQIKASAGARGEIFIHKKEILQSLKKDLPDHFISDIK